MTDDGELLRLLDLEQLDVDLFRARNPSVDEGLPLFGGQVAAQALLAAVQSVPSGRYVHSMHGYYLRAGTASRPILLHVDRDRDGGSYSARHVVARQNGDAIFTMSASFHQENDRDTEVDPTAEGGELPHPPSDEPRSPGDRRPSLASTVDVVPIVVPDEPDREAPDHFWVRSRAPLPDDRALHEAVLMYVSDISTGFTEQLERGLGGPSLDHAVWYHEPVRLDGWLRVRLEPLACRRGRALYSGTVFDVGGRVVASLVQQHVMRPRRAAGRGEPDQDERP